MLRCRALISLFACSFLLLGSPAAAQIDTGVIVGRVSDDSGGVLPGVTVTATQQGTGLVSTSTTNERGEYIFPDCASAPTTLRLSCKASAARCSAT
jgi:hypothetical protein